MRFQSRTAPKLLAFILGFTCIATLALAQQNLTDPAYYSWKGKKTEPKPGFVILKSGTRMEGALYLQGKNQHVDEIHLIRDEKDIEPPPASLHSYGLMILDPTNDTGRRFIPMARTSNFWRHELHLFNWNEFPRAK